MIKTTGGAEFAAFFISFAISALLGPVLIPFLRKLKIGQTERSDGPESHLKKQGTPTMGALIFLPGVLIASLIFLPSHPKMAPVLLLTYGFAAIGFTDDYLKVVKRRSDGLLPKQKLMLQVAVTVLFAVVMKLSDISLSLRIPFMSGTTVDIGIFAYPLILLCVIGTDNGTNFTDGVDGLASSVTAVVAVFFAVSSWWLGGGVAPLAAAMTGGLLGFLVFNCYPAKIFMGDTGSLALGGFVAGMAYVMQMPLFILIVGLIYLVEVISVIIQVVYFKKTGGKRFFRMAPIHHHFEKGGWSETKVVTVFTIVTILLCAVGLAAL